MYLCEFINHSIACLMWVVRESREVNGFSVLMVRETSLFMYLYISMFYVVIFLFFISCFAAGIFVSSPYPVPPPSLDVTAIIYIVASSSYNMKIREDNKTVECNAQKYITCTVPFH